MVDQEAARGYIRKNRVFQIFVEKSNFKVGIKMAKRIVIKLINDKVLLGDFSINSKMFLTI